MKHVEELGLSALRQLGELRPPPLEPAVERRLQARIASELDRKLEDLARSEVRRRTRLRAAVAGVALAAAVSLLALKLPRAEESPRILATTGQVTVAPGALASAGTGSRLEAGRRVDTGRSASAELLLTCKATLAIEELTSLSVEPPAAVGDTSVERVALARGRIAVRVPKLLPGHRLVIETPDATVTVRGTRFSVSVEEGLSGRIITRVSVAEGRVEVASAGHAEFLTSGREWSSAEVAVAIATAVPAAPAAGPAAVAPQASASSGAELVAPESPGRVVAAPVRESPGARVAMASVESELAEENRIFTRALQNGRAGNTSRALADLEELLKKHPRSPLMQSVRVEYFRLLYQAGNVAAAAREARAYLSAFPAGFARAEARRLALLDVADSP